MNVFAPQHRLDLPRFRIDDEHRRLHDLLPFEGTLRHPVVLAAVEDEHTAARVDGDAAHLCLHNSTGRPGSVDLVGEEASPGHGERRGSQQQAAAGGDRRWHRDL